jgi:hypothetical protein
MNREARLDVALNQEKLLRVGGWLKNQLPLTGVGFVVVLLTFSHRPKDLSVAGDFRAWLDAAISMRQGQDPYISSGGFFKSGPVSPWFIYFFHRITIDESIFFYSLQALNLLGIAYFAYFLLDSEKIGNQNLFILITLTLISSSNREMLINGQLTGLLFGGSVFVVKQWRNFPKHTNFSYFLSFPVALILIDMKPNMILPLFAILLLRRLYLKEIYFSIVFWLLFLIIVEKLVKADILLAWVRNLLNLNDASTNSTLYGSLNFWQFLNQTLPDSSVKFHLLTFLPVLLYLGLIIFFGLNKFRFSLQEIVSISFTIPFFYSYSHYYSYTAIIICTFMILIKNNWAFFGGALVSFYLVSFQLSSRNVLLSLAACFIILVWFRNIEIAVQRKFLLGWVFSLILRLALQSVSDNSYLTKSLLVSIPAVFAVMIYLHKPGMLRKYGGVNA